MNNAPRQTLRRIITKYGNDLCGDKRRCEGLLKDLCGEYRREINVLTSAIEERVPLDLLAAGKSMPRELLLTRLAKRLEDNLGLTEEAAHWAVDSWALALGAATDGEVEEKKKKQAQTLPQLPNPIQPSIEQNNKNVTRSNPSRPPQPPPPKIYPPIARTPVNVPLPKSPSQRSGSNVNLPQSSAQTANSPPMPAPKRRFRKFFGCLFVLFFLAILTLVLVFGVPYALDVMRETQRQNEPPRFPSQ